MGTRALATVSVVLLVALGSGLVLAPLLLHHPLAGFLLAGLGLYLSFYLTVNLGQAVLGVFLTMGFTLISATGMVSVDLAEAVIQSMVLGLLGPAVQDSAVGRDVYQSFAVRMGLFVALTLYAWGALSSMEWWRTRRASAIAGKPRA